MFCGFFAILVSIRGEYRAGRRPDRPLDRLRHHRRRGRPAGRRGHPVRPAVRLAGRPGLLRPGAGPAGLHAVLRRAATSGTRWAGSPASSGWPARRSGWPGSTRRSTRPPTSGTSSACPAPGAAGVVLASVFAFGDQMQGRDRLWVLLVVVVPALLMVSNIRFRSFRSLVSPKSGKPVRAHRRWRSCSSSASRSCPASPASRSPTATCSPRCCCPIVSPLARLLPDAAQGGPLVTVRPDPARTTSRPSSASSASSPTTRRRCTRCGSPRSSSPASCSATPPPCSATSPSTTARSSASRCGS